MDEAAPRRGARCRIAGWNGRTRAALRVRSRPARPTSPAPTISRQHRAGPEIDRHAAARHPVAPDTPPCRADRGARGTERLLFATDAGAITCRLHWSAAGDAAVLWVFGAGGGLGGPAGGVYTRLARPLREAGVTSLELDYRHPGRLDACVADVLLGIAWLLDQSKSRVVLIGHSFGGDPPPLKWSALEYGFEP